MNSTQRRTRIPLLAAVFALVAAVATFTAAPSGAATTIPIHWQVDASTHIKSLNMDVTIPTGTFDGEVDLATGALTGHLNLPPASKKIKLFGAPLASTTFAMTENGPITGHVDLATMTVTVNTSFDFAITQASLSFLPWLNLVGRSCRGTSPIDVSMTGPVSLTGPSSFAAEYTLPELTGCGLATPLLNAIVPGGGNTFTASFAPAP